MKLTNEQLETYFELDEIIKKKIDDILTIRNNGGDDLIGFQDDGDSLDITTESYDRYDGYQYHHYTIDKESLLKDTEVLRNEYEEKKKEQAKIEKERREAEEKKKKEEKIAKEKAEFLRLKMKYG